MKRSIIAFSALVTFSFASATAFALPVKQDVIAEFAQDSRKEITYEELPQAVKTAFEESENSEMEVTTVYEVQTDEGVQYELSISDGTDTSTVTYDAEGNPVE